VSEPRRCAQCDGPLPATATDRRRYCSVQCRGRAYNQRNPPPDAYPSASVRVRLHWHRGAGTLLAGDVRAGYWRGPEGWPA